MFFHIMGTAGNTFRVYAKRNGETVSTTVYMCKSVRAVKSYCLKARTEDEIVEIYDNSGTRVAYNKRVNGRNKWFK